MILVIPKNLLDSILPSIQHAYLVVRVYTFSRSIQSVTKQGRENLTSGSQLQADDRYKTLAIGHFNS